MSTDLREALEQVARRFRRVRLWGGLAACWLAWAVVGAAFAALSSRGGVASPPAGWLLGAFAGLATMTAVACAAISLRSARDPRWVARRIEAKHPELGTGLLAAVEIVGEARPGYLQSAVIRDALEHRRSRGWDETVPTRTLRGTQLAHAAALASLVVVFAVLIGRAAGSPEAGLAAIVPGGDAYEVQVDPGDAEVERGSSLLVVARFPGAVPADASLVVEDGTEPGSRRAMSRSLEDPTFAGRVESVAADLSYRVAFAGRSSETYHVVVFEYPELQRADAKLVFPGYTALAPKTVEDVRHVTAVEGTELTLLCRLNKDVASALLVDEEGREVALSPDDSGTPIYRASFTLADPRRFKVRLVDREGRANKQTAEIVVNVTRNRPPTVAMSQPGRDVRVSPVEELRLKAQVEDDFGVVRHGLSYSIAGGEPREVVMDGPKAGVRRVTADHLIDFEALKAAPDQLVTYFVWAEDVGTDGKPRRADGDLFFAEVRHFEEVFRQGEPPPSSESQSEQQQGTAQESAKLADLQKQIINATWTLIRRETGAKPTAKFVDDAKTLQESQRSALEQADGLGAKLRDAASKANLEAATRFMKAAEKELTGAVDGTSIAALRPALVAEQAAYQALLKLRAREFDVVRNNARQQSGASSGSPSQQQLDQLELKADENRYEEQKTAKAKKENLTQKEQQQQRETRQVLNRLRELAQRQTDLNERLKELQSALEAAKDEPARQEIERQLKRLKDQQQQVLRDTDELRERMEREENRDRMAEARQQVEQTREHVRQASEALEQGRLPQAVTEGARAERQLNDLREELRKKSSDRFAEEMTEMRDQARQLDEGQKRLSDQLDAWENRARQSLRDDGERKAAREGLERQQKGLDGLLDRMRQTVQEAEETEPLLAKELFNTSRKAGEGAIPDALKDAEQLVDAGVPEEAAKSSRRAGQGIEQLREGVERAAKSVLGDGTAALRRAQGEVEDLADQVNREIAQATGREAPARPGDPSRPAPGRRDAPQPGQPGEGEPQDQAGQPGERQAGSGQQAPQGAQMKGAGQQGQQRQGQQQQQQGQQGQQQGQQGQQGQGQQQGQQGQQQGQQGQQGQGQQQGQQGQGRQGQQQGQQGQQGQQAGQGQQGQQQGQRGPGSLRGGGGGGNREGGIDRAMEGLAGNPGGPITGEGFRQWSDRMRDVEELIEDPNLRAEAARIRDRARGAREEFKRHSKEPNWDQLKELVADPLRELNNRLAEEVRRRESPDSLVPIDRDPVPPRYAEGVRRYYERLGSGR